LMNYVKGPDFPTGAKIVGYESIEKAYKTGRGKLRVRANFESNPDEGEIVITEIPFQQDKSKLVARIADLVNDGVVDGVRDLRDESDKDGIRIVVELKRDALIDVVENQLIDNVLEKTFGVINLALVDGQPKVLTLKEMLQHYLDHRVEVVTRRSQHLLDEAEQHAHILEGRLTAVKNAEDIVELIRNTENRDAAIESLQSEFEFSESQATHVVRMQLGSLTSMESEDIQTDYEETLEEIERLENILENEDELFKVIKNELEDIQSKYGESRRTEIIPDTGNVSNEDLIPEEDIVVIMTEAGYLKRMNADTFTSQSRGGKGVIGINLREGDTVSEVFTASTHDRFLAFTNQGNIYSLKGYDLPDMGRMARGSAVVNILQLDDDEQLVALHPESEFEKDNYLLTVTKKGYVKKTQMDEFSKIYPSGLRALTLEEDDELVDIEVTNGEHNILLATDCGKSIKFDETDVRPVGRTARGVNGIRLEDEDYVTSLAVENTDEDKSLLTITQNGYGKRTPFSEYHTQSRYGKGAIDIQTDSRNGKVATALSTCDENELMIVSKDGQIMKIDASEINDVGRNTKGVRVMSLDGEDLVASASVNTISTAENEEPEEPEDNKDS